MQEEKQKQLLMEEESIIKLLMEEESITEVPPVDQRSNFFWSYFTWQEEKQKQLLMEEESIIKQEEEQKQDPPWNRRSDLVCSCFKWILQEMYIIRVHCRTSFVLKQLSNQQLLQKQASITEETKLSYIKEELRRRKDEIRRQKGSQQLRSTIPTTLSLTTKGRILVSFAVILLAVIPTSCESNTVECSSEQYVLLEERAVVKCGGLEAFPSIYWYNNANEDATAFIQKVNGEVAGVGYTAGDFDIDSEGSLVINNVKIRDERTFRVRVLDSSLIGSSYDITLFVYAEPAEPLPVIYECSGQSTCILKGYSDRVISCIHGQSKPAIEVSWFLRDGREDRLLNATVNHTVSADAVTVTTSATLAVEEIPTDANMNQLVVLVCKSVQAIPGMKGTERKILLDISNDNPFTNAENLDPVYAIETQEDFMIMCQSEIDNTSNVVLWMYKSLSSEDFENILYSAYGEVAFTTKGEAGFNMTGDGALVIKEVDRQHEGYYACASNLKNTTVSFVQNLEVIVLPKPQRIVVEGCKPFQPCHLSAQEAETITCTVNGVRPQVDLSIVTYATKVAVTKTAVHSHKEDGLFYMTVTGHVDGSKVSCGQNVTVICQARGPAAYGFMSDAYVTVPVDGNECIDSSTDAVLPNDDGFKNHWLKLTGIVSVPVILLVGILVLAVLYGKKSLSKIQHTIESKPHQMGVREETPNLEG